MSKKKENAVYNTIILVVISVIAVALLAIVNQITINPIKEAEANQKAQAYLSVYPDCDKFAEIENLDTLIADGEALLKDRDMADCTINDAMACKNASGNIEGYVISATSSSGYGGDITVAIGIKDGKLTGFEALSNNETAGLGSKCTEPEFAGQFKNKAANVLSFSKTGASSDTEIDAISGATITTKAVTRAVNAAILFYQQSFGGGAEEAAVADYTEFYKKAYPNANEFADIEGSKDMIASSTKLLEDCGISGCSIIEIKAVNGGEGYVVCASGTGFAKTSPFIIAVGIKDDSYVGFTVIDCMETEGYGAKMQEQSFADQFNGKKVDAMVLGSDANGVDAIAGATITSNAVVNTMNSITLFYQQNIKGGVTVDTSAIAGAADAVAGATE